MYRRTDIPSLVVDLNLTTLSNGKYRITGVGINPAGEFDLAVEKCYFELGQVVKEVSSKKRLEYVANDIVNEFTRRYRKVFGLGPATKKDMLKAFELVKADVLAGKRLKPSWEAPGTNRQKVTFFGRNILELLYPFVNPDEREFYSTDRDAIEKELIIIVKRHNKNNQANAEMSARNYLRDADIIYAHMRDKDERLPELRLSSDAPYTRPFLEEQIKALPRPFLMEFYARLDELIEKEPHKVFFAVFIVFGLRPAEAAGRKPCDIKWYATYCTAEVTSQERKGLLDPRLKNEYSRRVIIIPYWGRSLLEKCCKIIGKNYPHDNHAMNDAVDCARWVKNLLLEIGINQKAIDESEGFILDDDLDTDDERKDEETTNIRKEKIACYVLRRVFATNMRSVMGFTQFETDRLMGHAPIGPGGERATKILNIDLNSKETQKTIAAKMERYIYDPRYSLNPSCIPIKLTGDQPIDFIEFSEYWVENASDETVIYDVNLTAAETGETISFEMDSGIEFELQAVSAPKSWKDHNRAVIGDTSLNGSKKGTL